MLPSGVSDELPLYLKSKYSQLNPPVSKKKPLKAIKSILRQGVSSDSPLFFQTSYATVVNNTIRNKEISGHEFADDRFLSDLKQNNLKFKPKFDYSDSKVCKFDYHSLTPSKIIDLAADKSPKIKNQTQFHLEFDKYLKEGFGIPRGQCTLEAMQPKVPRYQQGQIEVLRNKLYLSSRHENKLRVNTGKNILNQTQTSFISNTPTVSSKIKFNQRRRTITPLSLNEIEEFEKNHLKISSPCERRQIYSMD